VIIVTASRKQKAVSRIGGPGVIASNRCAQAEAGAEEIEQQPSWVVAILAPFCAQADGGAEDIEQRLA
jgi:hypothetical protein